MRSLTLCLLLLSPVALAADPETPPIGPPEPELPGAKKNVESRPDAGLVVKAPAAARDAGAPAKAAAPDAGSLASAVAAVVAPKDDDPAPPSTRATALCDELRKAAGARAASRAKLDEERKALAAERVKLEALAADVARAREALKAETERLEGLLDSSPSAQATPTRRAAPTTSAPDAAAGAGPNIATLAKSLKTMKGPQAAALISKMNGHLAAQVLQQMSPRDSGAVLGSLKPELAAELMTSMATLPAVEARKKDK